MTLCTTTGLIRNTFVIHEMDCLKIYCSGSCFNYHHHHWMAVRQLFPPTHAARPVDLSFFVPPNHKWFWGRIKIPVGVYHLKPVQDLLYVDVCVSKKEKGEGTRKEMGEYIVFLCVVVAFFHVTNLWLSVRACFHQCLVKCIWSSHTPPTPVPDSLLFIPCPCPSCCITYAEGFRCVCTCVRERERVCVSVCVCMRVSVCACVCRSKRGMSVCLFKRTKERKRGRRWEGAKMHYVNYVSECVCLCVSTCLQQQV